MSTIIDIMLGIRERHPVFYHKDTKQFDRLPYSETEILDLNEKLTIGDDRNTVMLPTYEEINHKDIPDVLFEIFDCEINRLRV